MKKIVIGLIGQIASGKDVAKKYLELNYGASSHRFSSILRDLLTRLHLPLTRENLQDISTILRQRFGEDLLAKIIYQDVKNDNHEIIIVDGIRRQADITFLKKLPNFILISLQVDPQVRYERVISRQENTGDNKKTYPEFLADEQKEAELEVPEMIKSANYQIDNNGSLKDLYEQIENIILELEKKHV